MKTHGTRNGGFTLIELLVVIAVIAALSGVTLTATRSMMKSGRRTKELHAARQLMAAYLIFPNDHDGELMRGYDKTVQKISLANDRVIAGEMCCRYPWRLAPYLGEQVDEMFLLNDAKLETNGQVHDSFDYQYRLSLYPALGLNAYCVGGYDDGSQSANFQSDVITHLSQAVHPSKLIVFASARMKQSAGDEEISGHFLVKPPRLWRTKWTANYDEDKPSSSFGNVAPRWEGQAICAFLDGSVQRLGEKELQDMRHWSNTAADLDDPEFVVPR